MAAVEGKSTVGDSQLTGDTSEFESTMGYEYGFDEYEGEEMEEQEHVFSIFDVLDAPRILPEPIQLDESHLDQLSKELGLIRFCWPDIKDPVFEDRINFPESYLKNSEKEKLLLYYAESFRRQFHNVYPLRKPLLLSAENECGMQKMVCTTITPTMLPYNETDDWEKCSSFVGDHLIYEALEAPTLIPPRLFSPHTVFLRKSGSSFDIATALCSLLIGLNYDAYVVSGYAKRDVTLKITMRVDSPYPEIVEKVEEVVEEVTDTKYVLKPPRDLRSKFLLMMEQREIDKANEEKRLIEEEKQRQIEEQEQPPYDELHGFRVHAWVLIQPGKREIEEPFFIEPSTGIRHETNSPLYCGIESVWNNENYWINMQDCSTGTEEMSFDLTIVKNWEHLLVAEPHYTRVSQFSADMEDEEVQIQTLYQEKHLDMPAPWGSKINIPHEVIQTRYPGGKRTMWYKRVIVDEFAPYIMFDGTVQRVSRYHDLECSPSQLYVMEERFYNRHDKMLRRLNYPSTAGRDVYFLKGREDAIKRHIYNNIDNKLESPRVIEYYSENRFDSMSKIELDPLFMIEHYEGREDKLTYRHVVYAKRGQPPVGFIEGPRRIITFITEKFDRDSTKEASDDIACREFDILAKEIRLKYHYGEGKVTASTRIFIKPPMAEMADRLTFDPALTSGYQAEIGAPPPRQLTLFKLLQQQINAETEALRQVRETEDLISEWLKLRAYERAVPKLDVSLFNREQNVEYRKGMLERELKKKESREKEVEEEIDFLGMYLVKAHAPKGKILNRNKAFQIEQQCLNDFKKLMVDRAMDIQHQFERTSNTLQQKQQWYSDNLDNVSLLEEETYFKEMNDLRFWQHTLQIRLVRLRDLSGQRYEAVVNYLHQHKALYALYHQSEHHHHHHHHHH
ncbi:dynein regulatory complex subunit 7 [Onthophagus taurus]|uniref:dynein regulatory complex subunit 7 n=1 Tax=Onthophagus taurus TaxID=166361 RepID=UPI000C2092ED|nr:dynein regulatory complex subunit 7 [Onthophagus taurus]